MTIKAVLIPMFSVSTLCGTMPLRFVSSFPFKLAVSPLSLGYTLLLSALTIYNSISTFVVVEEMKKPRVTTITSSATDRNCNCTVATPQSTEAQYLIIQVFNPQILIIMSLGAHWVSIFRIRPHLPLFIDYLISIDSKLPFLVKGLSVSKTYYSLALRFVVILAASLVIFGFYLVFHSSEEVHRFVWIVTLVFHNFVSLTCELQLLIFILMIKSRFQIVNRALSSMCHRSKALQKSVKSQKNQYPKIEKGLDLQYIELAHECYLKLMDAWTLLNKIYAVQVLFSTSGCFLKALFNVYFLSSWSVDSWGVLNTDSINSAMWMVFYFSRFAMLALVASSTSDECDKTKAITSLMSHWYDDPSIKEELDIFWMYASCRKLTFSTCGLFTLNSGLIIKVLYWFGPRWSLMVHSLTQTKHRPLQKFYIYLCIVACVTGITYLVLLVQFKPQIGVN